MTSYSRSCPKTIRQFYDDFDLLPRECKELLWYNHSSPDFDDLKAAWELARDSNDLASLIERVNCLQLTPEEKKAKLDAEKKAKLEAKRDRLIGKYRYKAPVYGKARLKDSDPKQARLVSLVSEEQAMALACKRKENKDVKPFSNVIRPIISWREVEVTVKDDDTRKAPAKPEPPQHILKVLHNAGGKS
jgi:hypothetical protein